MASVADEQRQKRIDNLAKAREAKRRKKEMLESGVSPKGDASKDMAPLDSSSDKDYESSSSSSEDNLPPPPPKKKVKLSTEPYEAKPTPKRKRDPEILRTKNLQGKKEDPHSFQQTLWDGTKNAASHIVPAILPVLAAGMLYVINVANATHPAIVQRGNPMAPEEKVARLPAVPIPDSMAQPVDQHSSIRSFVR